MITESSLQINTNVCVRVWDLEGNLISEHEAHNMWTEAGLNVLRDWISGKFTHGYLSHIAWIDTDGTEASRAAVTKFETDVSKALKIRQYLPSYEGNGFTLNRLRAYNAQTGGVMLAEVTFNSSGVLKSTGAQITADWTHTLGTA